MMPAADMIAALSSGPRRFAAVDFDARHLRIVLAERAGKATRVTQLTHVTLRENLDASDPQAMGEVLARALRDLRASSRPVVMSVPRSQAVLKPLRLPSATVEHELPQMVRFQVEKELPFRIEDAVVDFTIARHYDAEVSGEAGPDHLDVLAAAVKEEVVEHYRQIALAAGVKLLRLGLRSNANLRCVLECLDSARANGTAVVHVTADETEIDIIAGRSLEFCRSEPLRVPTGDAPTEVLDQAVAAICNEVIRSLQTFRAAERGARVDRLLIAGGTGVESAVVKALAERLGLPCERFDPSRPLSLDDDGTAGGFLSALGLAVGTDAPSMPIDFLNPKRPRPRRNTGRIRKLVLGGLVAALLVAGVVIGRMEVAQAERDSRRLWEELNGLKRMGKKLQPRVRQVGAIESWRDRDAGVLRHWAALSCLLPSCEHLYVKSLQSVGEGALRLALRADGDDVIVQLARSLGQAKYDFKTGRVSTRSDELGYLYATNLEVLLDSPAPAPQSLPAPSRPEDDVSIERGYVR